MHHHIVAGAAPLAAALKTIGLKEKAVVLLSESDGITFERNLRAQIEVLPVAPGGEVLRSAEVAGMIFRWPASDRFDDGED